MTVADIAKVTYEANRAYAQTLGDNSFAPWDEAPDWQKETNIKGVEFRRNNPGCGALEMHQSWMEVKVAEGWVYGETKNPATKEHPCLVAYEKLPPEQQAKDRIFAGIVDALLPLLE
jgi:hypothetical protein